MNRFEKAKERANEAVDNETIRHNPEQEEDSIYAEALRKAIAESKNVIEFRR